MKKIKNKEALETYSSAAKVSAQKMKQSLVKSASIADRSDIKERLYRMILYTGARHDWYDNLRHRFLNIGLALIGASAALAAFAAEASKTLPFLTTLLIFLGILSILATGLTLVLHYNHSIARRHPYRRVVDIRSWYFMYTFPSRLSDNLSKKFKRAKGQIDEIIDAYKDFLTRWLEYSQDPNGFIEEDLEQVFILQLLQRYRYQAVKAMSKILSFGVTIAIAFMIFAILSFLLN